MNRIALYIFLILIFLGISRSFSPSERGLIYIQNDQVFSNYFSGAPLSIILVNETKTGFFIKTYYQKYKVIYGFQRPYFVTVRTSQKFWEQNRNNIGLSIFRRDERNYQESVIPMPPGILYLGNRAYGDWIPHESGTFVWRFHKAYRDPNGLNFPVFFGWKDFVPTRTFHQLAMTYFEQGKAFYGQNQDFGTQGNITRQAFPQAFTPKEEDDISWKEYLASFLKIRVGARRLKNE